MAGVYEFDIDFDAKPIAKTAHVAPTPNRPSSADKLLAKFRAVAGKSNSASRPGEVVNGRRHQNAAAVQSIETDSSDDDEISYNRKRLGSRGPPISQPTSAKAVPSNSRVVVQQQPAATIRSFGNHADAHATTSGPSKEKNADSYGARRAPLNQALAFNNAKAAAASLNAPLSPPSPVSVVAESPTIKRFNLVSVADIVGRAAPAVTSDNSLLRGGKLATTDDDDDAMVEESVASFSEGESDCVIETDKGKPKGSLVERRTTSHVDSSRPLPTGGEPVGRPAAPSKPTSFSTRHTVEAAVQTDSATTGHYYHQPSPGAAGWLPAPQPAVPLPYALPPTLPPSFGLAGYGCGYPVPSAFLAPEMSSGGVIGGGAGSNTPYGYPLGTSSPFSHTPLGVHGHFPPGLHAYPPFVGFGSSARSSASSSADCSRVNTSRAASSSASLSSTSASESAAASCSDAGRPHTSEQTSSLTADPIHLHTTAHQSGRSAPSLEVEHILKALQAHSNKPASGEAGNSDTADSYGASKAAAHIVPPSLLHHPLVTSALARYASILTSGDELMARHLAVLREQVASTKALLAAAVSGGKE